MKIARIPNLSIGSCCNSCQYYTKGSRLTSYCSKHDCSAIPEQVCSEYVLDMNRQLKASLTSMRKKNLQTLIRDAFKSSQEVVPIKKSELLKYITKRKREILKFTEDWSEDLYVTSSREGWLRFFLLNRPFEREDLKVLSEKENLLHGNYCYEELLSEALCNYLYDLCK